jgi:hypothetical protein
MNLKKMSEQGMRKKMGRKREIYIWKAVSINLIRG